MSESLKDAINDLATRHGTPPRALLEPALLKIARQLPAMAGDERPAKDYDTISDDLARRLAQGERLSGRQARDCSWCLWTTRTAIAEDPETLGTFLDQMRDLRHKGASRALALSYLISFHPDRPGLSSVAAALRDLTDAMGKPFDALQARFSIFDVEEGPRRVGDTALAERRSPRQVLEENGLLMELVLGGGYVEPCARRVLERAAEDARLPPLGRLEFVEAIAVKRGTRQFNFVAHKGLVADALLLPNRDRAIDAGMKDQILNFLISLEGLGDPRTKGANWVNAPDARDIAISWLTEQALRQFLDVVEAVNPNENWKYRRRFWETMYVSGIIKEAWVVLDGQGAAEAHRKFGRESPFGSFRGGVQSGHAVLLLRIGRGVCAEWSYSGQCRFWDDAERTGAPKLYQREYDTEFLKYGRRYAPILEIRHSSHTGPNAWQHKAARQITAMTGERLSARDYML
ncbi:MAG: EH signature domain-containing protein [Nitratireductor sp.]